MRWTKVDYASKQRIVLHIDKRVAGKDSKQAAAACSIDRRPCQTWPSQHLSPAPSQR